MKKPQKNLLRNRSLMLTIAFVGLLAGLFLYQLSSLTSGISGRELKTAVTPLGWHGLINSPYFIALDGVRSVVFVIFGHASALTLRLPNVLFGVIAVAAFTGLIYNWHGKRTTLLAGLLFATSAWVLHVSRIATYDVMYLTVIPVLIYLHVKLQDADSSSKWLLVAALTWSTLALLPGIIWLVLLEVIRLSKNLLLWALIRVA